MSYIMAYYYTVCGMMLGVKENVAVLTWEYSHTSTATFVDIRPVLIGK